MVCLQDAVLFLQRAFASEKIFSFTLIQEHFMLEKLKKIKGKASATGNEQPFSWKIVCFYLF